MPIMPRRYQGDDDLRSIQAATAHWIASGGFCGYLHIGDIALRLFNGMRAYDPREIVRLWEDADGSLLGWAMTCPCWNNYEALLHPAQRGSHLESDILDWCEQQIAAWLRNEDRPEAVISLDVFADDAARITALERRGYARGEQRDVIAIRSLDELIPDARLPEGFSIRAVTDGQEADKLIEAMNASFGWKWTADEYRRVMQSPAYQTGHSLVVAAPDGRFASFCFVMLDAWNRMGMFEDVGTHPDFQRRGLGRALLYDGMKRMKAQGMDTAFMPYVASHDAASALYASVGLRIQYRQVHYTKAMSRFTQK